MEPTRQDALRFWALGAFAVMLSAGAVFSYFHSLGYGMAAGDLIGLQGREGDVAYAKHWATIWLTTAVCCVGASGLAGGFAVSIYEGAASVSRLLVRMIVGIVFSFLLTLAIGFVSFSLITSSHQSVVR